MLTKTPMDFSSLNDQAAIIAMRNDVNSEYWGKCAAFIQHFLKNRFPYLAPQAIEDASQEALFMVYKNLPTFQGNSSFKTWISVIAFHYTVDMLRKQKNKAEWRISIDSYGDEEEKDPLLIKSEEDPENFALRQERLQEVHASLEEFLQRRRNANRDRTIMQKIIQGYSYNEIACEFKTNSAVISSVLYAFRKFWDEKKKKDNK